MTNVSKENKRKQEEVDFLKFQKLMEKIPDYFRNVKNYRDLKSTVRKFAQQNFVNCTVGNERNSLASRNGRYKISFSWDNNHTRVDFEDNGVLQEELMIDARPPKPAKTAPKSATKRGDTKPKNKKTDSNIAHIAKKVAIQEKVALFVEALQNEQIGFHDCRPNPNIIWINDGEHIKRVVYIFKKYGLNIRYSPNGTALSNYQSMWYVKPNFPESQKTSNSNAAILKTEIFKELKARHELPAKSSSLNDNCKAASDAKETPYKSPNQIPHEDYKLTLVNTKEPISASQSDITDEPIVESTHHKPDSEHIQCGLFATEEVGPRIVDEANACMDIRNSAPSELHLQFEKLADSVRNRQDTGSKPTPFHASSYSEFIDTSIDALKEEEEFQSKNPANNVTLRNGAKKHNADNGGAYYEFAHGGKLNVPDGTDFWFKVKGNSEIGEIVYVAEKNTVVFLPIDLGDKVKKLKISLYATFLLRLLQDRLNDSRVNPSRIAINLAIAKEFNSITPDIPTGQETAIQFAIHNDIAFIWGPPGTGKTWTLAAIAKNCIDSGKSVLMVSGTNVAVDEAILKLGSFGVAAGKATRCGYPQLEELISGSLLWSRNLTESLHPELAERITGLKNKLRGAKATHDPNYEQYRKDLKEATKELSDYEDGIVKQAQFVATTLSKASASKSIYERSFDVVLYDEISMTKMPELVFAATMAKEHICCFGDPKQLPPIVTSDNDFLKLSPYEYEGISKSIDANYGHKWLVLLDQQYRYHKDIADFISRELYQGRLKSEHINQERLNKIAAVQPCPGHAIAMVDMANVPDMRANTKLFRTRTHYNLLAAIVDSLVAIGLANRGLKVGVISPYKAQANLVDSILSDFNNRTTQIIRSATVHRFQGDEVDAVVFDVTDSYPSPRKGLGFPLSGPSSNNLINVAITRTKGKFVLVGDSRYLNVVGMGSNFILKDLITGPLRESSTRTDAAKIFAKNITVGDIEIFEKNQQCNQHLLSRRGTC